MSLVMRLLILSALAMVFLQPCFSQDELSTGVQTGSDDELHGRLTSTYREFFKQLDYDLAMDSWWTLFNEHPDVSERLYVDGITMYRQFIEDAPEGPARDGMIDTMMLIYDQRMAFFDGEGNIIGRKGTDLLRYKSDDTEHVQAAYGMLKKSLDIEGTESRETVMLNCMAAGLVLNQAEVIDNNQVMADYFMVMGLLDQQQGSSSRRERTRASIDGMIQKENILTCEGLDLYYGPQFENSPEDAGLLKKIIQTYASTGCKDATLYTAASEQLYELDPGSESAHQLAMLFIGKEDLEKAAFYLQMALVDDQLPNETRAEWLYELSVVCLAKGEHCEAITFAREAIANRKDYGEAYLAAGDAFVASREELGDDFQQRSAFWAAADMYRTAARLNPALDEETGEKLAMCEAQFPHKEDNFFHDLREGESFHVGGCIMEQTTVRSRKED